MLHVQLPESFRLMDGHVFRFILRIPNPSQRPSGSTHTWSGLRLVGERHYSGRFKVCSRPDATPELKFLGESKSDVPPIIGAHFHNVLCAYQCGLWLISKQLISRDRTIPIIEHHVSRSLRGVKSLLLRFSPLTHPSLHHQNPFPCLIFPESFQYAYVRAHIVEKTGYQLIQGSS